MELPNFHKILADSPSNTDYLSQLSISDQQNKTLRKSRDLARDAILDGFRNWGRFVKAEELLVQSALTGNYNLKLPKFKMQGSFAYKTLNSGAQMPPQEIDLDDGLFLPVSYEEFTGSPEVLSGALFSIVEQALQPLCEKFGWQLATKDTCVRIILNRNSHAHIDIALYAIEEKQYYQLREAALSSLNKHMTTDDSFLFDEMYKSLPADFIMLAHRKRGWIHSDPRKLEDWFNNAINVYGYQLRRICRYLKGWRDQQWVNCQLSSISLMKVVVDYFQSQKYEFDEKRDDIALKNIAAELPNLLRNRIENPVIQGSYLDEGWSEEDRQDFISKSYDLANCIDGAFMLDDELKIIVQLRSVFGDRIPNDSSLITVADHTENSVATSTATSSAAVYGLQSSNANATTPSRPVKKSGGGRYA